MHSMTKASGIAVSMLVAATASVLLLLPEQPRVPTSRGAGMSPAIMVASATASPPGPALAVSGAAHGCLPPAAPAQHCRVSGDSTGGTRAATAGRRRCRHGPLPTASPRSGAAGGGWAGGNRIAAGRDTEGRDMEASDGVAGRGTGQAGATAAAQQPAGRPANCPTGIPRRPR